MQPETVEALKSEYLEAGRRYARLSDRPDWREGDSNLDVLAAGSKMRLAAKAWQKAERELYAVTCPPRTAA